MQYCINYSLLDNVNTCSNIFDFRESIKLYLVVKFKYKIISDASRLIWIVIHGFCNLS